MTYSSVPVHTYQCWLVKDVKHTYVIQNLSHVLKIRKVEAPTTVLTELELLLSKHTAEKDN